MRPLVIVDAANVVGSVPDGWWRDRHSAAERLRDALVSLKNGLPEGRGAPEWVKDSSLEVVLVVEGAARAVEPVSGVRVEAAPGSGDDRIVELVKRAREETPGRPVLVITADRELRRRVRSLGAQVAGPRAVRA
jgi:hypothetical protein